MNTIFVIRIIYPPICSNILQNYDIFSTIHQDQYIFSWHHHYIGVNFGTAVYRTVRTVVVCCESCIKDGGGPSGRDWSGGPAKTECLRSWKAACSITAVSKVLQCIRYRWRVSSLSPLGVQNIRPSSLYTLPINSFSCAWHDLWLFIS